MSEERKDAERAFETRTEEAFRRWGLLMVRHRWIAMAIPTLLTAYFVSWVPLLVIDNSTEGFLLPDDPATVSYREFRDRFDRDDRVLIALAPPDVFDPAFLEKLRRFHLALEDEVPNVHETLSLFNVRDTRGEGDELVVGELLEGFLDEWPDDLSELEGLRERVLANPLYINSLVSEDARLTTVVLEPFTYSALGRDSAESELDAALAGFDDPLDKGSDAGRTARSEATLLTAKENDALLAATNAVIARFEAPDFPIHIGGPLAVTDYINRAMERDMGIFMPLAVVVVALFLYALFRRVSGAVLPMVVVILSVLSSIGVMVALGIPGTTAVQILPVFLLTVGVCDAVHILTITYQRIEAGDEKTQAIAYAIGHSGMAVVMTSATTAAGMASFLTAEMVPVAQLGIMAPVGVFLALAYTLVMLPAILSLAPLKPRPSHRRDGFVERVLGRALVRVGDLAADRPRLVLLSATLFVAICLLGAVQVRFSHLALEWFEPGTPVRVASEVLDRDLRGAMSLEVVVDTGRENGLHDPELLRRIEEAQRYAEGVSEGPVFVGKATSIVDIVKETHKALNENRVEFYRVPDDRQLVAQELLLFENGGAEDLEQFVDSQFQTARISLRAPFVNATLYGPFMDGLEVDFRRILGPEYELEMTGFMPVLASVVSAVIVSMMRSYAFALLIITPMMILLLRSVKLGLVSMIPNLIPVVFTLGVMGLFDVPMDATQIMIGAMVIGVAVDDTIHFMHKFRLYYRELGDPKLAIRETLSSTGMALLLTSIVLSAGFFVLSQASLVNLSWFGLLAGSAAIVAFVADVLVAPALMAIFADRLVTRDVGGEEDQAEASA